VLGVARRKKREASGEGVRVGFYRRARPVEERQREGGRSWAEPRTASGAGVPSGAWQPLGSGGPTWQGVGRTTEAAQAVGGGVGRRVEGRRRAAGAREAAGGGGSRARRGRGARGLEEDDGGPKCNITEKQGPYFNV
jgi:hypothetical protein